MGDIDPKTWSNFQAGFNKKLNIKSKSPEELEIERQKKIKEAALKAMYDGVSVSKKIQ